MKKPELTVTTEKLTNERFTRRQERGDCLDSVIRAKKIGQGLT